MTRTRCRSWRRESASRSFNHDRQQEPHGRTPLLAGRHKDRRPLRC
jgi:hypothetical protein